MDPAGRYELPGADEPAHRPPTEQGNPSTLATAERVRSQSPLGPVETVWHIPADPEACTGDCDAHRVLCGDGPGVSVPGGIREVPEKLTDRPDEHWCAPCLAAASGATVPAGIRR